MRKIYFLLSIVVCLSLSSCFKFSTAPIVTPPPIATNTINAVDFSELNLDRSDYKILNTIEVSSIVTDSYNNKGQKTISNDSGFTMTTVVNYDKKTGQTTISYETEGVIRAGFLSNDYSDFDFTSAEAIARLTAIDRLISMAKEMGGDAVIDPIISTNVESGEPIKVGSGFAAFHVTPRIYKTTVSAKVIVINTDK